MWITCPKCGAFHLHSTNDSCWIKCECGAELCNNCGSIAIAHELKPTDDNINVDQKFCLSCLLSH